MEKVVPVREIERKNGVVMMDREGGKDEAATGTGTGSRRWRNLISRSRSPSSRRNSGDESVPATKPSSRRRPRRAHTIDNTMTSLVPQSHAHSHSQSDQPTSPCDVDGLDKAALRSPNAKSANARGSLLQRFLASTSRRRSQTNTSGEGSTVSRMTDDEPDPATETVAPPRTRRATMDAVDTTGPTTKSKFASFSVAPPPSGSPGGLRNVLRRFSGDGPVGGNRSNSKRRGSRDHSLEGEFPSSIMEEKEYKAVQERLQRRADDLHKSGQIKEAISQWVECLALAEENFDSLASKTEILCVLVDLHLQAAQASQHHNDDEDALDPEEAERGERDHRETAKRYVHRIKPALVKSTWWSCTNQLIDFLVESEAWELAILVAERLAQEPGNQGPDPEQLATIHFQIASQKLDSHRQGEALQHLQATVKNLQQIPVEKRDMIMYVQVLQLLATEYTAQGQHDLALEAYQDNLRVAPVGQHASLYCKMAHIYIVTHQLDLALEQLESAASTLHASDSSIRLQLLQTKGDVYCRLGRTEESFQVYQSALEEAVNPAEKAKLLYTLGRLCIRLKRMRLAISYFTREMEITEAELGHQHMSVSRVLHELAKLYDEGLGEHKMALMKLHKALHIELAVLQECHVAITTCQKCNQVTHRMCTAHANLQRDVSNQIRETKKAQGRIHFKLGDFEKALKTSFDGTERTATVTNVPRRARSSDL